MKRTRYSDNVGVIEREATHEDYGKRRAAKIISDFCLLFFESLNKKQRKNVSYHLPNATVILKAAVH